MAKSGVRKHRSEQEWRELVRGQSDSGLSVLAWCEKHGLAQSAFYRWRARCGQPKARRTKAAFVRVRVRAEEPADRAGQMEIILAGGRTVRLSGPLDRQLLAGVLAVLEGPAC
jgi:hypothetical protein